MVTKMVYKQKVKILKHGNVTFFNFEEISSFYIRIIILCIAAAAD